MSLFKPATRHNLRLRMLLVGLPGAGKTMSALRIARGVVGPAGRIAVIDTDAGAAATKYANLTDADGQLLEFDHLPLGEAFGSFDTVNYIKAVRAAVQDGYDAIIIDSLTHAWSGKGGILEQKDRMGGKFNAWGKLTPKQQEMVEAIVNAQAHVIATVRAKQTWIVEDRGAPKMGGLGPDQRAGLEYEFDVVLDIDRETHRALVTKSRCAAVADKTYDRPGLDFANDLREWLNGGEAPEREPVAPVPPEPPFDMVAAAGVPEAVLDAVARVKGWAWREWSEDVRRKCVAEQDFAGLAKAMTDHMVKQLHTFLPAAPTLKSLDGDKEAWEAAKEVYAEDKRKVLQSWYGVESATELTVVHAAGERGVSWLTPKNGSVVRNAYDEAVASA